MRIPKRCAADWAAALVALPVVCAARLIISLVPFRYWRFALARTITGRTRPSSLWTPLRIGWAVERTAQFVPDATCLTQALAARALLLAAGHPSTLVLGVRKAEGTGMDAHAWIESGHYRVVGVPDEGAFQEMDLPRTW